MMSLSWFFGDGVLKLENLSIWRVLLASAVVVVVVVAIVFLGWVLCRVAAVFRKWMTALGESRAAQFAAETGNIREDKAYDLHFLHRKGFVQASGTGQSITEIYAEVKNLIGKRLHIVIKPGTCFVADGRHQNMVTRSAHSLTIDPYGMERFQVKVSCLNANRPIPGGGDRFSDVARVTDDLARFLEASEKADPEVVQAGIWALTDAYSGTDVQRRLVMRGHFDLRGRPTPAISDSQIEEARRILNRLRIRHNL